MKLDDNILNLIETNSVNYKSDFNVKYNINNNQYDISHNKYNLCELSFVINENDKPKKIINNTNLLSVQTYLLDTQNSFYYKLNNFLMEDFVRSLFNVFNENKFEVKDNFFKIINQCENGETYEISENLRIQVNGKYNSFYNKNMDIRLTLILNDKNEIFDSISHFRKLIMIKQ